MSKRSSFIPFFLILALGCETSRAQIRRAEDPPFTEILSRLKSEPIEGSQLVYWDQAVADALNISTPMGRIGNQNFESAVLNLFARYIAPRDTARAVNPSDPFVFFVEDDAMGGAGRAGYLKTPSGTWVNLKGIGTTGQGRTFKVGPPESVYSSHQDGSATLDEAIKEALYARSLGVESPVGSSRVLAIIKTPLTLQFPNGEKVTLAIIVREAVPRFDYAMKLHNYNVAGLAESIGHASAMRFFKGDLVNSSNIGAGGEWVDFGCTTATCEYGYFASSQGAHTLIPATDPNLRRSVPEQAIWDAEDRNLLVQAGLPEEYVLRAQQSSSYASQFQSLSRIRMMILGEGSVHKIDYDMIPDEVFARTRWLRESLHEAAPLYFEMNSASKTLGEFGTLLREKVPGVSPIWTKGLFESLDLIRKANTKQISDERAFAAKLRILATQRGKDAKALLRPEVVRDVGSLVKAVAENRVDPLAVQNFIDARTRETRLSTHGFSEGFFHVVPDAERTNVYMRAEKAPGDGRYFAHSFPEWGDFAESGGLSVRVSTDAGKTDEDFVAAVTKDIDGKAYFKFEVPHGSLPVTSELTELRPFQPTTRGPRWLMGEEVLKTASWNFNQRLGLPIDQTRWPTTLERAGIQRFIPRFDRSEKGVMTHAQFAAFLNRELVSHNSRADRASDVLKTVTADEIRSHFASTELQDRLLEWTQRTPALITKVERILMDAGKPTGLWKIGLAHPVIERCLIQFEKLVRDAMSLGN